MPSWNEKYWAAGTIVRVLECLYDGETRYLGEGKLLYDFFPDHEDIENQTVEELYRNSPTILMKDGRIVRGYQCWWIPVEMVGV